MPEQFSTPILFLIFNRPETAELTFKRIRRIKPRYLYLAADGPRASVPDDALKCLETRQTILKMIDWDCEVKTLFRENNLGLGQAVSSAIGWFFSQVDHGIIIEDDCLASETFFYFCQELLSRYQSHENIFIISGNNNIPAVAIKDNDYIFSRIPSAWGWATWRRVWEKYDFTLAGLDEFIEQNTIAKIFPESIQQNYWLDFFREIKNKKINNWDYQLAFTCFKYGGLTIVPRVNLVFNIGFPGGTKLVDQPALPKLVCPLRHPAEINANAEYDQAAALSLALSRRYRFKKCLKKIRLFNTVKRIYKKIL